MMKPKIRVLTVVCCFTTAMLIMPTMSVAGGFGCQSCATPVAVAPTYTGCVTQTCGYMPTAVYRALYQPRVVTAYRPVYQPAVAYSAYSNYAVTTYRPWYSGWSYRARLVPYTTYQPVYRAAPVVAYTGCSPCVSSNPCNSYSPCAGGACGTVTYGAPASGCSSCAAPATSITPAPQNAAPPKTFQEQEKVQKPTTETELKPIPQSEMQLNSTPAPLLPDPRDRTASRTVHSSARITLVGNPVETPTIQSNDGWQPARD